MKLGEFIKQYRDEHGMSQREFAASSGLTNGYISMLENDKNPKTGAGIKPTLSTYKAVSNATGVSVSSLMSLVDDDVSLEEPIRYGDLSADKDVSDLLDALRTRPEMRMLFSVSKDASKEDIEKAVAIIEALRKTEGR